MCSLVAPRNEKVFHNTPYRSKDGQRSKAHLFIDLLDLGVDEQFANGTGFYGDVRL